MKIEAKTTSVLERIVEARRAVVARRKQAFPEAILRYNAKHAPPARDFAAALERDGLNIIAELKKASPSRGVLRRDFQTISLAAELERAGAAALSVLTEEDFFQGSLMNLAEASKTVSIPVLRKDFIFDAWQVWEARANDADSFLLIAAILGDAELRELIKLGRELDMEPLVEVHSAEELARALDAGARILGVNNRDLRTFDARIETSFELIARIPDDRIAVSESGLRTHEDLVRLRAAGFDAFLIGEHLMQAPLPGEALAALLRPGDPS
ncbi:MAG: indole-3-glycerol phosphate synthase TrpC [Candidatus Acidiferrales bacterium]